MDGYIAEIRLFAGNFAPRNWAFCNGQLLAISSNNALFSLIGTYYGGDGVTTFALPDCRGRVSINPGSGAGLSTINLGQKGGSETTSIGVANLPAHNHGATLHASSLDGEDSDPTGQYLGKVEDFEVYQSSSNVAMGSGSITVGNTGSSVPVNNVQPFIGLNYIICLVGTYPTRN